MKKTLFEIPVLFAIKETNLEKAQENIDRIMRYAYNALSKYEQDTTKSWKSWNFIVDA